MSREKTYTNRYGDEFKFTILEDKDILWQGPFKYYRFGKDDNDNINMVDPSGGPYIGKGDILYGLTVEGFQPAKGGFLIKTNKDERKRFN